LQKTPDQNSRERRPPPFPLVFWPEPAPPHTAKPAITIPPIFTHLQSRNQRAQDTPSASLTTRLFPLFLFFPLSRSFVSAKNQEAAAPFSFQPATDLLPFPFISAFPHYLLGCSHSSLHPTPFSFTRTVGRTASIGSNNTTAPSLLSQPISPLASTGASAATDPHSSLSVAVAAEHQQ